jgi:large subunit ribosomal protein L17
MTLRCDRGTPSARKRHKKEVEVNFDFPPALVSSWSSVCVVANMSNLAKLGRDSAHRRALLRNMVTSLIKHETILTTTPKAKALKRMADRMVTLAKENTLASRRRALAYVTEPAVVTKLFDVLGPRFADRPGGYTSVQQTTRRPRDAAPMAFISYLRQSHVKKTKKKAEAPAAAIQL